MARQILLVDTVASRYHCLPSEILTRADTFDVWIINNALDLHQRQQQKSEVRANGGPPPAPQLSQEQMRAMIAGVRNKNGNNTN